MELAGKNRVEFSNYLDRFLVVILSLFLIVFPLLFTTFATDPFVLPKQALLVTVVLVALLAWGLKMLLEGGISLRRTPFDLPLFLYTVVVIISSVISLSRADALTNSSALLLVVLLFWVVINAARTKASVFLLTTSFLVGCAAVAAVAVLSYYKIYIIPSVSSKTQLFSPIGSLYDQALFLLAALLVSAQLAANTLSSKSKKVVLGAMATVLSLVVIAGVAFTLYGLVYVQKPIFLPFLTGFQTAFASISQDTNRLIQSFLFGSGYGTYINIFTRFKPAAFNQYPTVWSFTFFRSSSYILEVLATVGLLGLVSFLFLVFRIVQEVKHNFTSEKRHSIHANPFLFALIVLTASFFILPFSILGLTLFFVVLALFSAYQTMIGASEKRFYDLHLYVVAFEQGIIAFSQTNPITGEHTSESKAGKENSRVLPFVLFLLILGFVGGFGYMAVKYFYSDYLFQKSLVAASQNKGSETYDLENRAIQTFGYRDGFYRIFSQTNLALANLLASQQAGKTPSQQTQQTIYTLIQQSINAGRQATTLSPQSALNWQNLSGIYRSLIGFGQNAEQFAVLANQQAVLLDPNNPQQYITLGGIYYQISQWDEAQRQFQIAVNLKQDFPNAYYNLGHALEQKGDLQGALTQYKTVKTLVANDPTNLGKINNEIATIEQKLKVGSATPSSETAKATDSSLGISKPETKLPEQKPPVKIPGVTVTPTPTK